jgi:hypothetical protein
MVGVVDINLKARGTHSSGTQVLCQISNSISDGSGHIHVQTTAPQRRLLQLGRHSRDIYATEHLSEGRSTSVHPLHGTYAMQCSHSLQEARAPCSI